MTSAMGHWGEWKERCALGLCSEPSQVALTSFAASRFYRFVRKILPGGGAEGQAPYTVCAADAWHLFETHLLTANTRQGKRYKDWLFARAVGMDGAALDTIQGGATLIIRDVVRDFLRAERSPSMMVSLNAPISSDVANLTLEDLLPGQIESGCDLEMRDFARLAKEHAGEFLDDMTVRERLALLARQLAIPLSHPAVEEAAGCRKSVLSSALREFVSRVAARLTVAHPGDDPGSLRILAVMTFECLNEMILSWGISEKVCARLFIIVKDRQSEFQRHGRHVQKKAK